MKKKARLDLEVPESIKEKARVESEHLFGTKHKMSAFIVYLINSYQRE